MTLRDRVRGLVETLPEGSSVTLPRSTLREWLLEEAESESAEGGGAEKWYSTSEVADLRGVEPSTVATWCSDGRFPNAEKTGSDGGGEWRIPERDLLSTDGGPQRGPERVRFD